MYTTVNLFGGGGVVLAMFWILCDDSSVIVDSGELTSSDIGGELTGADIEISFYDDRKRKRDERE